MKTDLYVKVMLTVIAGCLVYLCIGRPTLVAPVHAQPSATEVVIVGWKPSPIEPAITRLGNAGLPVRTTPK